MKKSYYVNTQAQANGDHEVHHQDCRYLPSALNRRYLGDHSSCEGAVTEAKKSYARANGCIFCSTACHTS